MSDESLKKAEQIAKDAKVKLDADAKAAEAKKQAEAKVAAALPKKDEGKESIVADAEKQAENDARILSAKDDELSEPDKTRKAELVKLREEKARKEEKPEDKEAKIKAETQKRIDEVIGDLKAEKAERQQDKKKIADLEAKLSELTKPKEQQDEASKIKSLHEQHLAKCLEEDKTLSREQRREMSKEELEEWLLDDYVAATEWLTDRNIRRNNERQQIKNHLVAKPLADDFIAKQQESLKRLQARYPGITQKDSDELKLLNEIVKSDPKKYAESVNGPELVADEMDKRKNGKKTITLTEEELAQKIKDASAAEIQRLASLDEGITSGGNGKRFKMDENKSEFQLKQEAIARKAGITPEQLKEANKRRETIGAGVYEDKE